MITLLFIVLAAIAFAAYVANVQHLKNMNQRAVRVRVRNNVVVNRAEDPRTR